MVYTYIYVPKSEVFNSLPIQKVIIHLKKWDSGDCKLQIWVSKSSLIPYSRILLRCKVKLHNILPKYEFQISFVMPHEKRKFQTCACQE